MKQFILISLGALSLICFTGCKDDNENINIDPQPEVELDDEWYAGGRLGTVFNATSFAYEQPTPAIEMSGMSQAFKFG